MHILLWISYGCFHATILELSSCDEDLMVGKADNIYYLALHRRVILTPDQSH